MRVLSTRSGLDRTEIHQLLGNDRRRAAIEVLRGKMGSISLRRLSELIAERETDQSPPPRNIRESVYNSLHQTHLPKLHERGIIEYDRDRKTILLDEGARQVYIHMEVVSKYGITWADYYRSLGVLALFAVVGSSLGVPVLQALEPLLIATVFLFVFAVSTASQLWRYRGHYLDALLDHD